MNNMNLIKYIFPSILLVFCLSSCGKKKAEETNIASDVIPVKVIEINQESIGQTIHASGVFTTEDETYLGFKIGGVIQHILVKEGDAIKSGQLLATLNLTEIKAQVQQAQIGLEKAERDFNRAGNLYKDSVATLEQFQNSKSALDLARQQISVLKFNQNYAEIRAVKSGYVLKKFANDGQVVGPGTPILQINGANKDNWVLKVGLSDQDWSTVSLGDRASVTIDTEKEQNFTASVVAKSEGVDPITGTLWVTLKTKGIPSKKIALGIFGKANILPNKKIMAWVLPFDAIIDGNQNQGFVFVTTDGKTAEKRPVKISQIEHGKVLISEGLSGVKGIITSGNAYLNDGSAIKIIR
jgi:RND family efflux transporter MFP subunit